MSAGSKKRVMTKRIMFLQLDKVEVTTLLQTGLKRRLTMLKIRRPWTKEWQAKVRQLVDRGLGRTQTGKSEWRQMTRNRSLDDSSEATADLRMTRIRSFSSRGRKQKLTSTGSTDALTGPS